jgi:DNA-binding HxlR family transcriptional regulator
VLKNQPACSIERSLQVVGERWTLLIVRELFTGRSRFADIRDALGIAPNLLSARLSTLVDAGVLETRPYQEPGQRPRASYHLTAAGRQLQTVLSALEQWGDDHRPRPAGPFRLRRSRRSGRPLRVAYLDDTGTEVPLDDVEVVRAG